MSEDRPENALPQGEVRRQPQMLEPTITAAIVGGLITTFGAGVGSRLATIIKGDDILFIQNVASWKGDSYFFVVRLFNVTAHGIYIERIWISEVKYFTNRSVV